MLSKPSIFLGVNTLSSEDLSFYLNDQLIQEHQGFLGKFIEHPLTLEALNLQKAFIISLLKKIEPKYDQKENPLKIILSLNES